MSKNELVRVEDLEVYFHTDEGIVRAVDGVSFHVNRGETLGVLGESGCGKSVTARSLLNLIPRPRGRIHGGEIWLHKDNGPKVDILSLDPFGKEMGQIRGAEISMIFQEPMTSLNPVYTIGWQIMEAILLHQPVSKAEARERAIEMLEKVGISSPDQAVDKYPHEFSGGMRQRAMIAIALACNPRLLIADEPTTALDVTIESQILELLEQLKEDMDMSILFITHDLGVIGEIADRVIVMYTGKIVETGSCVEIFYNPKHPYTQKLLESRPRIGQKGDLSSIVGSVPSPYHLPPGCRFAPRCEFAMDKCIKEPPTFSFGPGHGARCWLYEGGERVG
ncbi:MAG: ABC transporter ATP-binding protein [Firmicutes bacterium]|nr:ABC transporter ATP-binding protein [Bacillota bacterium]